MHGLRRREIWIALGVSAVVLALAGSPWIAASRDALADPASLGDWPGAADARLLAWVLAWNAHAAWTQPLTWFDANIFAPAPNMLAGSESLIGLLPISLPIYAITLDPILTANLTTWITYVLSAVVMYAFLRLSTVPPVPSAVGAALFCFGPFRLPADLRVLQLPVFFLPLVSIAVQTSRPRHRLWLPLVAALALTSSLYMAAMSGCILLLELLIALTTRGRRETMRVVAWLSLCLPPVALVCVAYVRQSAIVAANLDPLGRADLVADLFWHSVLHENPAWRVSFDLACILAVVGVLSPLVRRERPSVSWIRWTCLLVGGVLLALGPSLEVAGIEIPLPLQLFEGTPLAALRGFPRFLALASLGVCGLAAAGAGEIIRASRAVTRIRAVPAAVAVLLLLGATLPGAWAMYVSPLSRVDLRALAEVDRLLAASSGPVLEIPAPMPGQFLKRPFTQSNFMLRSANHWRPLVNGHTGYTPWWWAALYEDLTHLPEAPSLAAVHELTGVEWIVVHRQLIEERIWRAWHAAVEKNAWLEVALSGDDVLVLRIERPRVTRWSEFLALGVESSGRTILGTPRDVLSNEAAWARISWKIAPPRRVRPGDRVAGVLRVRNLGTAVWPGLARPGDSDHQLVVLEGSWPTGRPTRVRLPRDVLPGDRLYVPVAVHAPMAAGSYRLAWRVRQVDGARFALSPPVTFDVEVVDDGSPPRSGVPAGQK